MTLDLSPARWIWLPSERTLPNTFVLFRYAVELPAAPVRAIGYVSADSRYRLCINGKRAQWGPAPCDPRALEADPIDFTSRLRAGPNVIAAEVLFYGHGDGTWVAGKPGFIFLLDLDLPDGTSRRVVSDADWLCRLDRAHRPGQHPRWYLRALQEAFDARLHPYGWDAPGYTPDSAWLPAMTLDCPPDRPPVCSSYRSYLSDELVSPMAATLAPRPFPMLREELVDTCLVEAGRVHWHRDPRDWFELRIPGAFSIARDPTIVTALPDGTLVLPAPSEAEEAHFLTFELPEQLVGWPVVELEAPAGTVVELICQEAHDPAASPWLDTHLYAWSHFICREGANRIEPFDFESLRWMQLHIHGADGPVRLRAPRVRRRSFPWPHPPLVGCPEPALQRLCDAALNTVVNCAQETVVDGMGRERQQYSGDVGHVLHAVRYAFGESRLPARFLRTFAGGLTLDGYFLDCWPAPDRLHRLAQRQIGTTPWGPLLDHGIGFGFDCWHHYWESGDLAAPREAYPRLLRFVTYLEHLRGVDGLLPVENLGAPTVWIDHDAYRQQRHKQCAFNLYAAAMLGHALAPLAEALGEPARASSLRSLGDEILAASVAHFWDAGRGLFVANLPWVDEEGATRLCDRSLATAISFGLCPGGTTGPALRALVEGPPELGCSYPANAGWRFAALAALGRADLIVRELRERWAALPSVRLNNTLQEMWEVAPDSIAQWSHCPVAPLNALFMLVAGIKPLAPGFARCEVRPQLADLAGLTLAVYTPHGPVHFHAEASPSGHSVRLELPPTCVGELVTGPPDRLERRPLAPGSHHFEVASGVQPTAG